MSDEIVRNLKKPSAWFRVLFMAGFVIALYVTGLILLVVMLAQIVFSLLAGEDNTNLRRLGAGLANYVGQILAFLTYNSEQKPFPFMPFPLAPADLYSVDPYSVDPAAVDPVVTEPAASHTSTQSQASESFKEAQAVADDDGFQNSSENTAATDLSGETAPSAAPKRSSRRKKKATDAEAPQTDD